MSRIGRKPIDLPAGVNVQVDGSAVLVKGPKGALRVPISPGIKVQQEQNRLSVGRGSDQQAALHGLTRSLLANAVIGVSKGFEKHMDIVGIGYRAEVKGKAAVFTLGYSHPVEFPIPEGISLGIEKGTHLVVGGVDKQQVGQVAAKIRALRPPDPYKNKGIRYTGERLKKKVGKAAAGAGGAKA